MVSLVDVDEILPEALTGVSSRQQIIFGYSEMTSDSSDGQHVQDFIDQAPEHMRGVLQEVADFVNNRDDTQAEDQYDVELIDGAIHISAPLHTREPDPSELFGVEFARGESRQPEDIRKKIYDQCYKLVDERSRLLDDIARLSGVRHDLRRMIVDRLNDIVSDRAPTTLLDQVVDEFFENARQEAIKRMSEGDLRPCYISTETISDVDENCMLCVDKPATCVCADCDRGYMCEDCLTRLRRTTGKCPNCQRRLVIKLVRQTLEEEDDDLVDVSDEPGDGLGDEVDGSEGNKDSE